MTSLFLLNIVLFAISSSEDDAVMFIHAIWDLARVSFVFSVRSINGYCGLLEKIKKELIITQFVCVSEEKIAYIILCMLPPNYVVSVKIIGTYDHDIVISCCDMKKIQFECTRFYIYNNNKKILIQLELVVSALTNN